MRTFLHQHRIPYLLRMKSEFFNHTGVGMNIFKIAAKVSALSQPLSERHDYGTCACGECDECDCNELSCKKCEKCSCDRTCCKEPILWCFRRTCCNMAQHCFLCILCVDFFYAKLYLSFGFYNNNMDILAIIWYHKVSNHFVLICCWIYSSIYWLGRKLSLYF